MSEANDNAAETETADERCPDCGFEFCECHEYGDHDAIPDEPPDMTDADADADALAGIGHGMDEDYNHYDYGDNDGFFADDGGFLDSHND